VGKIPGRISDMRHWFLRSEVRSGFLLNVVVIVVTWSRAAIVTAAQSLVEHAHALEQKQMTVTVAPHHIAALDLRGLGIEKRLRQR
jgi:hypothetical protein